MPKKRGKNHYSTLQPKECKRNGSCEVSLSTHCLRMCRQWMVWKSAELKILQRSFSYSELTKFASRTAQLNPGDQNQGKGQRLELLISILCDKIPKPVTEVLIPLGTEIPSWVVSFNALMFEHKSCKGDLLLSFLL